jgi:hypothetical protein
LRINNTLLWLNKKVCAAWPGVHTSLLLPLFCAGSHELCTSTAKQQRQHEQRQQQSSCCMGLCACWVVQVHRLAAAHTCAHDGRAAAAAVPAAQQATWLSQSGLIACIISCLLCQVLLGVVCKSNGCCGCCCVQVMVQAVVWGWLRPHHRRCALRARQVGCVGSC